MNKKNSMLHKISFLGIALSFLFFSCSPHPHQSIHTANGKSIDKAQLDEFFKALMDTLEMPGLSVVVINHAEIVYEEVFGLKIKDTDEKIHPNTFFEAASLSKPLFAFFVLKQVDKGILDLDQPLYQYLPYPDIAYDERYQKITARMILSHTAGFPNWRSDRLKIHFDPGTRFQYSGEGYHYLALVLAKINQLPIEKLDSLFQEEVVQQLSGDPKLYFTWNPQIAHNKATGHLDNQPTDNLAIREDIPFGSAGGLHTNARSYARFLIALMNRSILTEAAYSELFQEQIKLPSEDINALLLNASGWSLGFGMIPTTKEISYWHSGNNQDFQSWFHLFPQQQYGIVLFTNSDKIQTPEFFTRFLHFLDDGIAFDRDQLQ